MRAFGKANLESSRALPTAVQYCSQDGEQFIKRLLDLLQDSKSVNTRHALTRDWIDTKEQACSDAEVPIEILQKLEMHIGAFGVLQEGPPQLGLEDVLGEHQASEGKPVTGQNHVVSTEDHQELTKYHLGTEQGDNALTAGVTEESSGMIGIHLAGNKSYDLAGLAGKEQEVGGPGGVTLGSSGMTNIL